MSALQLSQRIGQYVLVDAGEGISMLCKVEDAKTAYGRQRVYVRPVAGTGAKWIEENRALAIRHADIPNYLHVGEVQRG